MAEPKKNPEETLKGAEAHFLAAFDAGDVNFFFSLEGMPNSKKFPFLELCRDKIDEITKDAK